MGDNCFVGLNWPLRDGIEIANHTLIGAGSFITKSTNEKCVYKSNFTGKSKVFSENLKGM